jgi:anti-sigma factor RsiW
MTELSDELLVAYVDGQLARKQTRAIDKVLEQDDVLDARVTALKHAHARLEAAFEAILAGEEAEISQVATPPAEDGFWVPWRTFKIAAASAGIALALGLAVLGYGWPLTVPGMGSAPDAAAPQVELQVAPERAASPEAAVP